MKNRVKSVAIIFLVLTLLGSIFSNSGAGKVYEIFTQVEKGRNVNLPKLGIAVREWYGENMGKVLRLERLNAAENEKVLDLTNYLARLKKAEEITQKLPMLERNKKLARILKESFKNLGRMSLSGAKSVLTGSLSGFFSPVSTYIGLISTGTVLIIASGNFLDDQAFNKVYLEYASARAGEVGPTDAFKVMKSSFGGSNAYSDPFYLQVVFKALREAKKERLAWAEKIDPLKPLSADDKEYLDLYLAQLLFREYEESRGEMARAVNELAYNLKRMDEKAQADTGQAAEAALEKMWAKYENILSRLKYAEDATKISQEFLPSLMGALVDNEETERLLKKMEEFVEKYYEAQGQADQQKEMLEQLTQEMEELDKDQPAGVAATSGGGEGAISPAASPYVPGMGYLLPEGVKPVPPIFPYVNYDPAKVEEVLNWYAGREESALLNFKSHYEKDKKIKSSYPLFMYWPFFVGEGENTKAYTHYGVPQMVKKNPHLGDIYAYALHAANPDAPHLVYVVGLTNWELYKQDLIIYNLRQAEQTFSASLRPAAAELAKLSRELGLGYWIRSDNYYKHKIDAAKQKIESLSQELAGKADSWQTRSFKGQIKNLETDIETWEKKDYIFRKDRGSRGRIGILAREIGNKREAFEIQQQQRKNDLEVAYVKERDKFKANFEKQREDKYNQLFKKPFIKYWKTVLEKGKKEAGESLAKWKAAIEEFSGKVKEADSKGNPGEFFEIKIAEKGLVEVFPKLNLETHVKNSQPLQPLFNYLLKIGFAVDESSIEGKISRAKSDLVLDYQKRFKGKAKERLDDFKDEMKKMLIKVRSLLDSYPIDPDLYAYSLDAGEILGAGPVAGTPQEVCRTLEMELSNFEEFFLQNKTDWPDSEVKSGLEKMKQGLKDYKKVVVEKSNLAQLKKFFEEFAQIDSGDLRDLEALAVESLKGIEAAYEEENLAALQDLVAADFSWADPNDGSGAIRPTLMVAAQKDFDKLNQINFSDVQNNEQYVFNKILSEDRQQVDLWVKWNRSANVTASGRQWIVAGTSLLKFKFDEISGRMKLFEVQDSSRNELMLGLTNNLGEIYVSAGKMEGETVSPGTAIKVEEGGIFSVDLRSISPGSGGSGSTVNVTISGENFSTAETVTVKLLKGSEIIDAGSVAVISATVINCAFAIPGGASAGSWDVQVVSAGVSGVLFGGFTVTSAAPAISSLDPNWGRSNDSIIEVEITGSNFGNNPTVKLSKSGESEITASIASTSSGKLYCIFDLTGAAVGNWDLKVINADNLEGSLAAGFKVSEEATLAITGLDYNYGAAGDQITISGSGFGDRQGVSTVTIGNSTLSLLGTWGENSISFIIPAGIAAGATTLTVTVRGNNVSTSLTVLPGGRVAMLQVGQSYNFAAENVAADDSGDIYVSVEAQAALIKLNNPGSGAKLIGTYSTLLAAGNPAAYGSGYATNISPALGGVYGIYTAQGKYAKILIDAISISGPPYFSFKWVYQPDGSNNFR